jgi:hypothetical protein
MGQTNQSNNLLIYISLPVQMTGKRFFRMPFITLRVSEWYTSNGFNFWVRDAFPPRSRVSRSLDALKLGADISSPETSSWRYLFPTPPCLIHIKNKIWWKFIVFNNFLEFGGEHTSCFNVGTSSLSTNFNAMNLWSLLEPYKPSFANSECLVSSFILLNFVKMTPSLYSNSTLSEGNSFLI